MFIVGFQPLIYMTFRAILISCLAFLYLDINLTKSLIWLMEARNMITCL